MLFHRKSLDLVSGLLAYLAWYHFYCLPRREKLAQLLSMAVSLCKDMGLTGRPLETAVPVHRSIPGQVGESASALSSEAQRLLLGTYYLERRYHFAFGTVCSLLCTDYIIDCAKSLALKGELPTDLTIQCLIQQQHAAERSHCLVAGLQQNHPDMHSPDAMAELEREIRGVERKLQAIKQPLPPLLISSSLVELWHCECLFYSFEGDVLNPFRKAYCRERSLKKASGLPSVCFSNPILEHCLRGAKTYLDTFLTIPTSEYHLLSSCQWDGLTYAIVVLYQLSLNHPHLNDCDSRAANTTVPLEEYLGKLCQQMEVAIVVPGQNTRRLFSLLCSIWRDVQASFTRNIRLRPDCCGHSTNKTLNIHPVSSSSRVAGNRCPARQWWYDLPS
ncbi:hypothetical protein BJX96DRAFT_64352 [Aspergillus floccosus]